MPTAHCVSTIDGIILEADEAFLDLVGRSEEEVIGMSYIDITHPDDIDRSSAMIASLKKRAAPFRLQKRYLRPDGTVIVTNLYVTRFENPERLVSTLFWNQLGRELPPARLWEMALRVKRLREVRRQEFGVDAAISPLGDILNCVYLAEAEGRIVRISDIAAYSQLSTSIIVRWIAHLMQQGIFQSDTSTSQVIQFTHLGLSKMERMLASSFEVPTSD